MSQENHRSLPDDGGEAEARLAVLRRRFLKVIDEEIAWVYAHEAVATCAAVSGRVLQRISARSSLLTAQLKDAFVVAQIRARVSRRLKHPPHAGRDAAKQDSDWFPGMEEWILPDLTWEDGKGRVAYKPWFDSFQEHRKLARTYYKQCLEEDHDAFQEFCAKDDRADLLVEEFGDLPLRELIRLDCERKRNEGMA